VITKLTPIDVEFAIPQDNAAWLQQQRRRLHGSAGLRPHPHHAAGHGVFASLDNQIDTTTGTVRAKARFNNARCSCSPASSSTCSCSCAPSRTRWWCR
jgi:multidrug efflux system membrane fusion protein